MLKFRIFEQLEDYPEVSTGKKRRGFWAEIRKFESVYDFFWGKNVKSDFFLSKIFV